MNTWTSLSPFARTAGVAALVVAMTSCNTRSSVFDGGVAPSAPVPPPLPAVPVPVSVLFSTTMSPAGLIGGRPSEGRLLLTQPAPAGGKTVALSTDDPSVTLPPNAHIPQGADAVTFPVTTAPVNADRQATITASLDGRTASGTLSLWSLALPTFFSFSNETVAPNGDRTFVTRRVTADSGRFSAFCSRHRVSIWISSSAQSASWSAEFMSRNTSTPLRTGTYQVQCTVLGGCSFEMGPTLSLSGTGICGAVPGGSFTIHELDMTSRGVVRRFYATFEERCTGTSRVTGEVRLTNPERLADDTSCLTP